VPSVAGPFPVAIRTVARTPLRTRRTAGVVVRRDVPDTREGRDKKGLDEEKRQREAELEEELQQEESEADSAEEE